MKKAHIIFKMSSILSVLVIIIALSSCSGPSAKKAHDKHLEGSVSISGAFALYPMTVKWAEEFRKKNPDVRIDISAGGAGKGMMDALSGMVELGMFSREISQAEIDKGAWYIAVAKDAVLPTISSDNPSLDYLTGHGFTQDVFKQIFLDDRIHTWGEYTKDQNSSRMNIYTRSDACGAAEMWGKYLGQNQEALKGVGVFGDPGIADAVKNDPLGIGYNNVVYAYDMTSRKLYPGLQIIPIDLNANGLIDPDENFYGSLDSVMNAIRDMRYPSPPARELYFVAGGKPDNPVVIAFLDWILSEGQQYVNQAGYVQLSPQMIESERNKLKSGLKR